MTPIPICCVTGRIAGDSNACGDCDPCGAAHVVPDVVKDLLKERDEWASKYEAAAIELDGLQQALRAFVVHGTYPVSTEINPRGYAWRGESALDYAKGLADVALANAR